MTDSLLIGTSQIKSNTTSTRSGAAKNLQTCSCEQLVTNGDCATCQEYDNCDSWWEEVNRTAWPDIVNGTSINNFYNNAASVELNNTAYLSGMADELIHPNYLLASHLRNQLGYGGPPDVGPDLDDFTATVDVSLLVSPNDILGSPNESHFQSVVPFLAVTPVRTSPPRVVTHGPTSLLLMIGISAIITYIVLVVMNLCFWAKTFVSILLRILYNLTCIILFFVSTSVSYC